MNELTQDIRRLAAERTDETARILTDLVSTPSFSSEEQAVVNVIRSKMESIGFDEIRTDGLGSIIGRLGTGPRLVAFDAHIDTVEVGERALWNFDPFASRIEDGKVWGRGAADQKGGMAAMITAASIIREYVEEGDITLADNETIDELPRVQKAQRVFSDAIDEWADALGCWVRKMEERYE